MAHLRKRHAIDLFSNAMAFSPLVGLFGHRQVGKTTFLEAVCRTYLTFDDEGTLNEARKSASRFLAAIKTTPAGIDECQLAESLFPALKERVRKNKKPGQIILSGSVRFYSRQAIRESLTGRIINIDLLPMCLTELCEEERATFVLQLIRKTIFTQDLEAEMTSRTFGTRHKWIKQYLSCGGLPGVCFLRNERVRSERIREQLQLILDRDVRLVYPTSVPYFQILNFLTQLALGEGEPLQTTVIRKVTGLSEATQKKLLQAFEAMFLVRLMGVEGDRKGICVYFEDQSEHLSLFEEKLDPRKAFEGLVYRNVRASFYYELGLNFRFFHYRARPDVRIPFAVKTKEGCLGFIPILTPAPSKKDIRMAHRFLQQYSPATVVFVTLGQPLMSVLEPRIIVIPAEKLLFD